MEILLIVTIAIVAASGLYVAFTFNKRTKQSATPLINDAINDISHRIEVAAEGLKQQFPVITNELRRDRRDTQDRFDRADTRISDVSSRLLAELETIKYLTDQIGTRQDELNGDLQQLDHRVVQFGDSLAQQGIKITEIYGYVKRRGTQTESSPEMGSLVLAMLEAEAHTDRKGWGQPPDLYALTEKTSPTAADHELPAEMRDARPGGLIPVELEPLPDGDPIEALANIHWPEDVVGCVLVTELTNLPPRGEEDAPIAPVAVAQWTSTRPDGRPVRLAVGVCRKGEHTCGLRIKGEDDVQIRPGLADDLVTALLGTF